MGAEGGGGDEDARGDVVEGGEAEGVQGAELEYGAGLAVAEGGWGVYDRAAAEGGWRVYDRAAAEGGWGVYDRAAAEGVGGI